MATVIGAEETGWLGGRLMALVAAFAGGVVAITIFPEMFFLKWTTSLVATSVFTPAFALSVCLTSIVVLWGGVVLGFPLSTSTVLLGATFGAGIVASTVEINADLIFEPGLAVFAATPILAWFLAAALHYGAKQLSRFLKIRRRTSIANFGRVVTVVPQGENPLTSMTLLRKRAGHDFLSNQEITRHEYYVGDVLGIPVARLLVAAHLGFSLFLSFLWGLIEIEKLMMVATLINFSAAAVYGGVALAGLMVGGLFFGKSVGQTLAKKITLLSRGSGMIAALTSSVVLAVTAFAGIPGSLTHSVGGSIMGVGMAGERLKFEPSVYVLAAWVVTWPIAMALGGLCYLGLQDLIP